MSLDRFPLSNADRRFLEQGLKTDTFRQTLLLEGGDDETRHMLALYLANALVCEGAGERPCGRCKACVKCAAHSHPDVRLYAPEKKNATFRVEVCRQIRQDAFVVPNDGDSKVYILEDSQNMNDSSENALLKILEEPPKGVYFLLTCTDRSAMLPTILSRATVVTLLGEAIPRRETLDAALDIAKAAAQNELALLKASAALPKEREQICEVLQCLCDVFEDALIRKSGAAGTDAFTPAAEILAQQFTKPKIYALYRTALQLLRDAEHNANVNLLQTGVCYRLRRAAENR